MSLFQHQFHNVSCKTLTFAIFEFDPYIRTKAFLKDVQCEINNFGMRSSYIDSPNGIKIHPESPHGLTNPSAAYGDAKVHSQEAFTDASLSKLTVPTDARSIPNAVLRCSAKELGSTNSSNWRHKRDASQKQIYYAPRKNSVPLDIQTCVTSGLICFTEVAWDFRVLKPNRDPRKHKHTHMYR